MYDISKLDRWVDCSTDVKQVALWRNLLLDFGDLLPFLIDEKFIEQIPEVGRLKSFKLNMQKYPLRTFKTYSGAAWVLMAHLDKYAHLPDPFFKAGFLLPLEWKNAENDGVAKHSELLPSALHELADKIKEQFKANGIDSDGFYLYPWHGFRDTVDFSKMNATFDSAWGALAIGLYDLRGGTVGGKRNPKSRLKNWPFSSIAFDFDANVPLPVSDLRKKIQIAAQYGAKEFTVSPNQDSELKQLSKDCVKNKVVEIKGYSWDWNSDLYKSLGDLIRCNQDRLKKIIWRIVGWNLFFFSMIVGLIGVYWWDCNREIVKYYKDYYERNGEIYGVTELSKEDVKSRHSCYRFVFQGYSNIGGIRKRRLKRLTKINSLGGCAPLLNSPFAYDVQNDFFIGLFPFFYKGNALDLHFEGNGRVINCYDGLGVRQVVIDFDSKKSQAIIEHCWNFHNYVELRDTALREYISRFLNVWERQSGVKASCRALVQQNGNIHPRIFFSRNTDGFIDRIMLENFRIDALGSDVAVICLSDFSELGKPGRVNFFNEQNESCKDRNGNYGYRYLRDVKGQRNVIVPYSNMETIITMNCDLKFEAPTNIISQTENTTNWVVNYEYDHNSGFLRAWHIENKSSNVRETEEYVYDEKGYVKTRNKINSYSNCVNRLLSVDYQYFYKAGKLDNIREIINENGNCRIYDTGIKNDRVSYICCRDKDYKLIPLPGQEFLGNVCCEYEKINNGTVEIYTVRCLNDKGERVFCADGWHCCKTEISRDGNEINAVVCFLGKEEELKMSKTQQYAKRVFKDSGCEICSYFYGESNQPIGVGDGKWHGVKYLIAKDRVEFQPFGVNKNEMLIHGWNCKALRFQGNGVSGHNIVTCLNKINGDEVNSINGLYSKMIIDYDIRGRKKYVCLESTSDGNQNYTEKLELKVQYDEKAGRLVEKCDKNGIFSHALYKHIDTKSKIGSEPERFFFDSNGEIQRKIDICFFDFCDHKTLISYAKCLLKGDGIFKDINKGVAFLEKLVKKGDREACLILGDLYREEFFNRKTWIKGSEWECLKNISDENLMRRAAQLYLLGNSDDAKIDEARYAIKQFRHQKKRRIIDDRKAGTVKSIMLPGGVPMCFCWCPSTYSTEWEMLSKGNDYFYMGSPSNELGRIYSDDLDRHQVIIPDGFWIAKTPVTQRQWMTVMHENPSFRKDDNMSVYNVSVSNSLKFCDKISKLIKKEGALKLPTEIQWEYACRAGTTTALNNGTNISSEEGECTNLNELGWYSYNTEQYDRAHTKSLQPLFYSGMKTNAWGICGMHGGVYEICKKSEHDMFWHEVKEPATNNVEYVCRGGCHYDEPKNCRSSSRRSYTDDRFTGFRPILVEKYK